MTLEKPRIEQELLEIGEKYKLLFSTDYGNVFLLEEKHILICELLQEYVPIDEFQRVFLEMSPLVKENSIKKLIFDKRALTTFHQPSMEWYFITWKKEMFELGLKTHRKLLPEGASWFKRAVEAGHAQIKKKYPENIIDKLDIEYRFNIKEAIES